MSLPVLHSFAGYSLCKTSELGRKEPNSWAFLVFCIILANFPDLDFIPGVLIHDAAAFHRGATHSIFTGLLISTLAGTLYALWRKLPKIKMILIANLCYGSHLLLDWLGTSPKGMKILWPVSSDTYYGPFTDFSIDLANSPLDQAEGLISFIQAVFSSGCIQTMLIELMIVSLFWVAFRVLEIRRQLNHPVFENNPFKERRMSESFAR